MLTGGDEAQLRKWIDMSGVEDVARILASLTDAVGRRGPVRKTAVERLLKTAVVRAKPEQLPDPCSDAPRLREWIEMSGVEAVARIIANLADPGGRRGPIRKLDIELLIGIAAVLIERPDRSLHFVAKEVAEEAHARRRPRIDLASLTTKLERDFKRRRQVFRIIAERRSASGWTVGQMPSIRIRTSREHRILARLIALAPEAIDVHDQFISEVPIAASDKLAMLKRIGRPRIQAVFSAAIKAMEPSPRDGKLSYPMGPPRSFSELIGPFLRPLQQKDEQTKRRFRGVRPG